MYGVSSDYITFYMIKKTTMHLVLIYIDNILKMGFDVLWGWQVFVNIAKVMSN